MKRTSRLIFIAALVLSSFLTGFTYQDIGQGGTRGALAALQTLPGKVASAVTTNVGGKDVELPPVETYWSVYSYLNTNYYGDKPESKQLTYQAIRGMIGSLGDRYTRFLDPDEHKQMQQDNRGDFEGIGAELDVRDGRVIIKKPIKNSPALKAGLQPNDVILKVDDDLVQGLDITEVVKKIRGDRGTKVKLTIKREEVAELLEIEVVRQVIPFTIVEWEMKDGDSKIGWIALKQFNEKSDKQFDEALTELEKQGMRALVLDLRDNPGGLLDVAVDIGSRFIPRGNVVVIQNKGGQKNALPVVKTKHNHQMLPLVVLINGSSASASEIVAGAIQDHKAGTLVGTDSFGKGLVQTIINLHQDGSAVAITTAKYLTPNGHDVTQDKIHPDVFVEPPKLSSSAAEDPQSENDLQLKRAIVVLKEKLGDIQPNTAKDSNDKS